MIIILFSVAALMPHGESPLVTYFYSAFVIVVNLYSLHS